MSILAVSSNKTLQVALAALVLLVSPLTHAGKDRATVVLYQESEPGGEPYVTHLVVTRDFLRIDDNENDDDFLLFDRKKQVIYNTNSTDKSILVIDSKPISLPDQPTLRHESDTGKETLPPVHGKPVTRHILMTNDRVCYDVYAAKGLLPDVVRALSEFRQVLSWQHARIWLDMIEFERDPCDLANNIFLPDRHLKYGLPIRQQDMDGRRKAMIDFRVQSVSADAFRLPDGYRRYHISDIRNR